MSQVQVRCEIMLWGMFVYVCVLNVEKTEGNNDHEVEREKRQESKWVVMNWEKKKR